MKYTPLNTDQDEIRLLRLRLRCYQHPQRSSQQLSNVDVFCELEHTVRENCISYTALSYAWGDTNGRRPICIGETISSVSINLEEALRELRHEQNDLVLWVDQISINQEDEQEKSHQVQQMKQIYAEASRVIAWVGPASENSDMIMTHLKTIGKNSPSATGELSKRSFKTMIDRTFAEVLPTIADIETQNAISTALSHFCQRSYWRRLWVIQEFAVGRRVDVACGSARISGPMLRRALDSIARLLYYLEYLREMDMSDERAKAAYTITNAFATSSSSFIDGIITHRHRYQYSSDTDSSLFYVLIASLVLEADHNHPECSNPRDRVFAILGLADDTSRFNKLLDYTISCEDVYTEVTREFLDQGHIDIFSYCCYPSDGLLPSWVPDWRMMTFAPNAYDPWRDGFAFSASGNKHSQQEIIHVKPGLVTLLGVNVDIIKELGSPWKPSWLGNLDPQDSLKYLSEIRKFAARSSYITSEDEEAQTARIAIADWDRAGPMGVVAIALDSYRRVLTSFATLNDAPDQQPTYDSDTWYKRALQFFRPCRPFISSSGFVGLAPCHAEIGDEVTIFLGGLVPYVLRQESDGKHSLIGEAYVHGIMYGEYMEGSPLIKPITLR